MICYRPSASTTAVCLATWASVIDSRYSHWKRSLIHPLDYMTISSITTLTKTFYLLAELWTWAHLADADSSIVGWLVTMDIHPTALDNTGKYQYYSYDQNDLCIIAPCYIISPSQAAMTLRWRNSKTDDISLSPVSSPCFDCGCH